MESKAFVFFFSVLRSNVFPSNMDLKVNGLKTGIFPKTSAICSWLWVFPEMVVPPKHPKMIIFSRKTNGCWVPLF